MSRLPESTATILKGGIVKGGIVKGGKVKGGMLKGGIVKGGIVKGLLSTAGLFLAFLLLLVFEVYAFFLFLPGSLFEYLLAVFCDRIKEFLDPLVVLGTGEPELGAKGPTKLVSLLIANLITTLLAFLHPPIQQIDLVSNYYDPRSFGRVVLNFLDPMFQLLERGRICYVEDNHYDSCVFVVDFGDCSVSLLAGGVPDVQSDLFPVFEEVLLLVEEKAEGGLRALEDEILDYVAVDDAGLSNS